MAEPLSRLTGIPAPLLIDNVDTDQIIPSREMKTTGKTGLADGLFAGWRYREGRMPDPAFVLNQTDHQDATILLGGANFGCGSSREHAVWALAEWGIRCVLAPSFAPIFAGNCVRNGVLPATIPAEAIVTIAESGQPVTVDLPTQTVTLAGDTMWPFVITEEAKSMLFAGLDAIELTLKHAGTIADWQARDRAARPWVYARG